ncbi:g709 [Coccomyxa elongata]
MTDIVDSEAHANFLQLSEDTRWWLGGFFDGDASIILLQEDRHWAPRGINISINHSVLTLKTLKHVHDLVGGREPHYVRDATEKRREVYRWDITGTAAVQLARDIIPYVQIKKPQYELAATYTDEVDEDCMHWALKQLKHVPHKTISRELPDSYFAGLFDAEGCVNITQGGSVTAKIEQKYPAVLEAAARKYRCGPGSVTQPNIALGYAAKWQVCAENCRAFLRIIRPYVVERQRMIDLVLTLDRKRIPQARAELATLVGNKGKRTPQQARARKVEGDNELPVNVHTDRDENGEIRGYAFKKEGFEYKKCSKKGATPEDLVKSLKAIMAYAKAPKAYTPKEERRDPPGMTTRPNEDGSARVYIIQSRHSCLRYSKDLNAKHYTRDTALAINRLMEEHKQRLIDANTEASGKEAKELLNRVMIQVTGKSNLDQPNMKFVMRHFG